MVDNRKGVNRNIYASHYGKETALSEVRGKIHTFSSKKVVSFRNYFFYA